MSAKCCTAVAISILIVIIVGAILANILLWLYKPSLSDITKIVPAIDNAFKSSFKSFLSAFNETWNQVRQN